MVQDVEFGASGMLSALEILNKTSKTVGKAATVKANEICLLYPVFLLRAVNSVPDSLFAKKLGESLSRIQSKVLV